MSLLLLIILAFAVVVAAVAVVGRWQDARSRRDARKWRPPIDTVPSETPNYWSTGVDPDLQQLFKDTSVGIGEYFDDLSVNARMHSPRWKDRYYYRARYFDSAPGRWQAQFYGDSDTQQKSPVNFTTNTPESVTRNSAFILDIWAHREDQYRQVLQHMKDLGRENIAGKKAGVSIELGSLLTITLNLPSLEVPDATDTITWSGEPTNASFIVNVPKRIPLKPTYGAAEIRCEGLLLASLKLMIVIGSSRRLKRTDRTIESNYPRTAFASYASENRTAVLARIQGMKRVAPDLDVFMDALSPRSGDDWAEKLEEHVPTKDIFYLFWSREASSSEWVDREWHLAMDRRGSPYIDPVPLDDPSKVLPPDELSSLHFNDARLAYLKYYGDERE